MKEQHKNSSIATSNRADGKVEILLSVGDPSVYEAMANEAFHRGSQAPQEPQKQE